MSFSVGQQVICISDQFSRHPYWRSIARTLPRLNATYTIRGISEGNGLIGFQFYEIVNPCGHFRCGYTEPAFNSKNFRPVKSTNIEQFKKLLAPVNPAGGEHKKRRQKILLPA